MAMIAGPGQGLQAPQALYPVTLHNSPFTAPTNQVTLQAGQTVTLPAGSQIVSWGAVSALQFKDPVTGQWLNLSTPGEPGAMQLRSDGFNYRVANLSGVATGAVVSAAGSGYVQATTVVTPSAGNSQWHAVVGGTLNPPVTITVPGANYSMPPVLYIAAPPSPGVPATGIASLTGGAVSGITLTNFGAGYTSPPKIVLVPNPTDPNADSIIQNAAATVGLTGAGTVTAVLLVNSGMALAAEPTLAVAGSGTGATATAAPAAWVAPAQDLILITPGSGP